MASVRWTVGARDDLRRVIEYVSINSTAYAAALADRMLSAVERLEAYPRLGRVVPEYEDQAIREIIVGNYRVVYGLTDDDVAIVSVVHGSRSLLRKLGGEPWDLS